MDNSGDLDPFSASAVDDPIVFEDELPQVLSAVFRHDSP